MRDWLNDRGPIYFGRPLDPIIVAVIFSMGSMTLMGCWLIFLAIGPA